MFIINSNPLDGTITISDKFNTSATASEFNGFPKPTSVVDLGDLLPSTEDAWVLIDEIHEMRPLVYSNTLPPIT